MSTTHKLLKQMLEVMEEQGNLCSELAAAKDGRVLAMWEKLGRAKELHHQLIKETKPAGKKIKASAPTSGGITEGADSKRCPTSPQSRRIADIFHRRHTTPWSEKEIKSYKALGTIPENDLAALESYYKSDAQFLRRDLYTFLNNFSGEVDRAHAWQREKKSVARSTFTA